MKFIIYFIINLPLGGGEAHREPPKNSPHNALSWSKTPPADQFKLAEGPETVIPSKR